MTFKEFWSQNKERLLRLSETHIKLALNCAAEDGYSAGWNHAKQTTCKCPFCNEAWDRHDKIFIHNCPDRPNPQIFCVYKK